MNKLILLIEYIHASSLIIDDMMDKDTIRRDKYTIHYKYGNNIA